MEDENELDQNLKDQNGNQNHDDDHEDQDNNQDQNDDDQNNDDGDDEGEDTVETLKEKLAKAQKAYEDQKKRAEKAEGKSSENKDNKKVEFKKNAKADDLSPKDLYALMENKVPKEDIDDVVQYAKFSKISVSDALETDFVTRLLADKSEKRATARATNIGNSRRGSGKPSGSSLLNNALQKGELPDSDEDLDRMIEARLEQKKQQASNKK